MMRWIDALDAWLDKFDFTSWFQITVLLLVMAKIYSLQVYEKLDMLVERTPSKYGWFRRAATIGESVAWLWLVLYLYEEHLAPRPPGLFLALASLANVAARLLIVQLDYFRAHYLGTHVASLSDALPSIRQSAEGAKPPREVSR